MRRRRRSSRWLATILAVAAVSGASFTIYRLRASGAAPTPLAVVDSQPVAGNPRPVRVHENSASKPLYSGKALLVVTQTPNEAAPAAAQPAPSRPQPQAVSAAAPATRPAAAKVDVPTTRPAAMVVAPATHTPEPVVVKPATLPGNLTGNALVDGRALVDANQPVQARTVLNEAIRAGKLGDADAAAAKTAMASINHDLILGHKFFADDPYEASYTVQFGDRLQKVAQTHDVTWEFLCRLNGITDARKVRAGQTLKVIKGPFHALVSKSRFTMDLYLGSPGEAGSLYVTSYAVGLGKDDSTPPGTWMVEPQRKLKKPTYYSPRGEGVIQAGDPRNPLGDYWIGLSGVDGQAVGKLSYGIHGTIDPDSIGKMASMGCIRMRNEDVALVFELLLEGKSTVIVKE